MGAAQEEGDCELPTFPSRQVTRDLVTTGWVTLWVISIYLHVVIMRWVPQTFHSSLPCMLPIFTLFFAPVPHSPFLLSLFPSSNSALSTFTQCVSAYTCVHVCACMSVYMCACMCIHVCICTCVFCICVREYLYVCVCESLFPSPCVCVRVFVCMCLCACVCVWLCMWDADLTYERKCDICFSGFTSFHLMISSSTHFPSGDIILFFVAE